MAVDAGDGVTTHAVRKFAIKWGTSRRVLAVKGQAASGRPIIGRPTLQDVSHRGKIIKSGVKLWPVGADTAKGWIYGHLKIDAPGPGFVHFPGGLPDEFFTQLTAERLVTRYIRGRPKSEWMIDRGRRNEALDCAVYALAAAHYSGVQRANWDALERATVIVQRDIFDAGTAAGELTPDRPASGPSVQTSSPEPNATPASRVARPRRPNWVSGF
jgi:phage terminase large subunit GpA-like protein